MDLSGASAFHCYREEASCTSSTETCRYGEGICRQRWRTGGTTPWRQAYRLAELARWSKFLEIPLNIHPAFFPVAGDPGSKLIIAALHQNGTDAAMALLGALGRACWAEEKNIADPDTLVAVANAVGLDGNELLKYSGSQTAADELQRNTEEAIAAQSRKDFVHKKQSPWL